MTNKNIKYLPTSQRNRLYRLLNISSDRLTDSDVEEIAELEAKADRAADRDRAPGYKRLMKEG